MRKQIELLINGYPVQVDLAQGRTKPKVACLGPVGTYTEAARHQLLGQYSDRMDQEFLPYNAHVVQRVKAKDFDIGIVPIENSTEGDVAEVLGELHHAGHLVVLGETILGVQHMLIGWPDLDIEEIRSHSQALGQCRTYLTKNYPGIKQQEIASTAAAVELVKQDKRIAAIASKRAAEVNGLPILAKDIGDRKGNSTRFLMIGRGDTEPTGEDSTTFFFAVEDHRGILAKCLQMLADYDSNITKIDSKPTGIMREYEFWITIDGHQKDAKVREALVNLRKSYCTKMRIVGSYRKAVLPEGLRAPGALNGRKRSNSVLTGVSPK